MKLKDTFYELKAIVEGIIKDEYYSPTVMEELEDKVTELHEDVDEACVDIQYWKDRYNDLDEQWNNDDFDSTSLENSYDCDILDEMKRRRLKEDNVIIATNLRDGMKVEILQELFNRYNLEQLQEINERLITGK